MATSPGGRGRSGIAQALPQHQQWELDAGQHILIGAYTESLRLIQRLGVDPSKPLADPVGPGGRRRAWAEAARRPPHGRFSAWPEPPPRVALAHPAAALVALGRLAPPWLSLRTGADGGAAVRRPCTAGDARADGALVCGRPEHTGGIGRCAGVPAGAGRWTLRRAGWIRPPAAALAAAAAAALTGLGQAAGAGGGRAPGRTRDAHRTPGPGPLEGASQGQPNRGPPGGGDIPVEAGRLLQPWDAAWAATARGLQFEPIVTCWVEAPGVRLPHAMVRLDHGPAQFAFDLAAMGVPWDGGLSLVVSDAGPLLEHGLAALEQAVLKQVQALPGAQAHHTRVVRSIAERRATFACTPGLLRPRAARRRPTAGCGSLATMLRAPTRLPWRARCAAVLLRRSNCATPCAIHDAPFAFGMQNPRMARTPAPLPRQPRPQPKQAGSRPSRCWSGCSRSWTCWPSTKTQYR